MKPDDNSSLDDWLRWLEELHPTEIELGLARVSQVAANAGVSSPSCLIITVGGTNGKGSVVEMLQQAYRAAGFSTGAYTSPHLLRFNERIRVDGIEVPDREISQSLAAIESSRADTSLTYFEYTTLAAMRCFMDRKVDVAILEVGLGGRLDAVNLWDTDCAVVTSIAIDHESWLGSDRDVIAYEKASISRNNKPLVVGEIDPPPTIATTAAATGARLLQIGRDFSAMGVGSPDHSLLRYVSVTGAESDYRLPTLIGQHQINNAACVLTVLDALQQQLPVSHEIRDAALSNVSLPGRLQILQVENAQWVLDVAHNPAAATALADSLASSWSQVTCHAVFAIMADKDVEAVVNIMGPYVASWHCADLSVERALPAAELATLISGRLPDASIATYDTVNEACQGAAGCNDSGGIVLVFGSFFTVSDALLAADRLNRPV